MDPATIGALAAAIGVPLALSVLRQAGRRVVPQATADDLSDPRAQLRERGWLFREFMLTVDGREYRVSYEGAGAGGERVLVDGQQAAHGVGLASLVPRLEFLIAGHRGVIELNVRWLTVIKGFRLSLDGAVLYAEGSFVDKALHAGSPSS